MCTWRTSVIVNYHFTVKSKQRAAVSHTVNTVCAHKFFKARDSCQETWWPGRELFSTFIEISLKTHTCHCSAITHTSAAHYPPAEGVINSPLTGKCFLIISSWVRRYAVRPFLWVPNVVMTGWILSATAVKHTPKHILCLHAWSSLQLTILVLTVIYRQIYSQRDTLTFVQRTVFTMSLKAEQTVWPREFAAEDGWCYVCRWWSKGDPLIPANRRKPLIIISKWCDDVNIELSITRGYAHWCIYSSGVAGWGNACKSDSGSNPPRSPHLKL